VAKKITRGEIVSLEDVTDHFYKGVGELTTEFYNQLEMNRCQALQETMPILEEIEGIRKNTEEKFDAAKSVTKLVAESLDKMNSKTDLKEREVKVPSQESILENWKTHKIAGKELSNLLLESSQRVVKPASDFYSTFVNMNSLMRRGRRELKAIQTNVDKINRGYERLIRYKNEGLEYYKKVLNKPQKLEKYPRIYAEVKKSAEDFVSKNPVMFTTTDTKKIKNIIDNPQESISRINPHTIDLIRNLELIPF
jgi:hypothetical protein